MINSTSASSNNIDLFWCLAPSPAGKHQQSCRAARLGIYQHDKNHEEPWSGAFGRLLQKGSDADSLITSQTRRVWDCQSGLPIKPDPHGTTPQRRATRQSELPVPWSGGIDVSPYVHVHVFFPKYPSRMCSSHQSSSSSGASTQWLYVDPLY